MGNRKKRNKEIEIKIQNTFKLLFSPFRNPRSCMMYVCMIKVCMLLFHSWLSKSAEREFYLYLDRNMGVFFFFFCVNMIERDRESLCKINILPNMKKTAQVQSYISLIVSRLPSLNSRIILKRNHPFPWIPKVLRIRKPLLPILARARHFSQPLRVLYN